MRVGIHQLHYLPWLRYLDKIARSDVFVVLDDIQYNKNGWQNRNRIKTASGAALLTVPVRERFAQRLDAVAIDDSRNWRRKHWETLRQAYGKAPYFEAHADFFRDTYARAWARLNELNRHVLEYLVSALGIRTRLEYSSSYPAPGTATERLAHLVRAAGGDTYYSGAYALEVYLDAACLARHGIALEIQPWTAPRYPQLHGEFIPDLSAVDLLLNCGPRSLEVLLGGAP